MASVTGFTAERMLEIENSTVVSGEVQGDNLVLATRDGSTIVAGNVRGEPGVPGNDGLSPALIKGVLDSAYTGQGSARVRVGGTLSSVAYPWLSTYKPNGSRQVYLQAFDSNLYIVGQTSENQVALTLGERWKNYPTSANDNSFNNRPTATRLSSGLVVLSGLLHSTSAGVDGELLFQLPEGMRPSQNLIIGAVQGDAPRSIQVLMSGHVTARGIWGGGQYLSLDGLTFFAAGTVPWTPIGDASTSFGAAFIAHPDPFWGVPSYYKDPQGFLWFQGLLLMQHNVSTDNWPMINLAGSLASDLDQHFYVGASDTYGVVGTLMGGGLAWKTGSPTTAGSWFTITNLMTMTPDALNNQWVNVTPGNSWVRFSANQPIPAVLRRDDGLSVSKGLIGGGGIGARAMALPQEFHPNNGRILLPTATAVNMGRIDIGSVREFDNSIQPGGLVPRMGNSVWFSLDGVKWVP